MENCKGILGKLFGHKFSAIYITDECDSNIMKDIKEIVKKADPKDVAKVIQNAKLERIIPAKVFCERCGIFLDFGDDEEDDNEEICDECRERIQRSLN